MYVVIFIDEPSLVRNNQDKDFENNNLINIISITLNTQAVNDNQVITKAYVDQFHYQKKRFRRDLGIDFYDESSDLIKNNQDKVFNDNKLTNSDSITVNRNPTLKNVVVNEKHLDDKAKNGSRRAQIPQKPLGPPISWILTQSLIYIISFFPYPTVRTSYIFRLNSVFL